MKKTIVFLVSLLIVISLAACGNSLSRAGQSSAEKSDRNDTEGNKESKNERRGECSCITDGCLSLKHWKNACEIIGGLS